MKAIQDGSISVPHPLLRSLQVPVNPPMENPLKPSHGHPVPLRPLSNSMALFPASSSQDPKTQQFSLLAANPTINKPFRPDDVPSGHLEDLDV